MLVFSDFFVSNQNQWATKDTAEVRLAVDNGVYWFEHKRTEGNWYTWMTTEGDFDQDFRLQTVLEKHSGVNNYGYGIAWALQDIDNFYTLEISGDGHYRIDRCKEGKWETIQDWTASSFVQRENTVNMLSVVRQGQEMHFFINEQLALSKPVAEFASFGKKIGFGINRQITVKVHGLWLVQGQEMAVKAGSEEAPADDNLERVLEDLHKLVGLKNIKEEVQTLVNFLKVQTEREKRGLSTIPLSLHMVLTGPPGTGKTTIARLIGRIYRHLGFLKRGHVIETDRAGLVAGYIGQTALKVEDQVKKAMGGLLFIDEAYALEPEGISYADFGQEAIDTLLKRMEDSRDQFAVIIAGYADEMERFLNSNPGVRSRFSRYFHFDHFEPWELLQIFERFCTDAGYRLTDAAKQAVEGIIVAAHATRDRSFGNARFCRNLFEDVVAEQSNRIANSNMDALSNDQLQLIKPEDVPGASLDLPKLSSKRSLN